MLEELNQDKIVAAIRKANEEVFSTMLGIESLRPKRRIASLQGRSRPME
jgi:hypothetical protein